MNDTEYDGVRRTNEETEAEAHGTAFAFDQTDAALVLGSAGFAEPEDDDLDDLDEEDEDEADDLDDDDDEFFGDVDLGDDEAAALSDFGIADDLPAPAGYRGPWWEHRPTSVKLDGFFYQTA